jgi:chemotaxis protein MotB
MHRNRNKRLITEDTNRWIVSYADFVTLLFAFFVVMYAISSVNVVKYKNIAEGLGQAFSKNTTTKKINPNSKKSHTLDANYMAGNIDKNIKKLAKSLKEIKGSEFELYSHKGWIELDIKANALFNSGSADINPKALDKIYEIADLVKGKGFSVALEGYTDNVPIKTTQYPSNWELSASRAAAIARILVSQGVAPETLSATGYASQFPIASNKTVTGRTRNRRVVVIIAKDKSVSRLLNPKLSAKMARIIGDGNTIPVMKEIRTEEGGVKFIRTLQDKKTIIKEQKEKP